MDEVYKKNIMTYSLVIDSKLMITTTAGTAAEIPAELLPLVSVPPRELIPKKQIIKAVLRRYQTLYTFIKSEGVGRIHEWILLVWCTFAALFLLTKLRQL